jgi:carbon monoxide dehydrogenase subunit G
MTSPRLSGRIGKDISMDSTVLIERPVEEVFGFVADLTNVASMDPSVKSVQKTSQGPIGAGSTFRIRQKAPHLGKVRDASVRYTAVKPNRKIEFKAKVGPNSPTARLTFKRVDGRTRVRFRAESNLGGPLKVLSALSTRQGQHMWDKRLTRLKRTLESPKGNWLQEEDELRRGTSFGKSCLRE